jgi:hypothetical protein
MRFPSTYQVAILALISLGATALAQQPGQPGQGGGRFRGGPPGGGGGGGMIPGMVRSRLSLLAIKEVRDELQLEPEMIAEIEKVAEEIRAKYGFGGFGGRPGGGGGPGERGPGGGEGDRGRRGNNEGALRAVPASWHFVAMQEPQNQPGQSRRPGGFGGFPMLTPEQRAEMAKQRVERNREEKARLAEILLPHQIKRLNEIFVQQAGVAALMDEDIAGQLGVSEAQKSRLAEAQQANDTARDALMQEFTRSRESGGGGDRDANRAKLENLQKTNEARLLGVLTPDQQKKFEAMKGKPFAMPENTGRFGGGDRGPGGGRPEGNNNP